MLARIAHEGRDLLGVIVAHAQMLARDARATGRVDSVRHLAGLSAIERVARDLARRIEQAERESSERNERP